MVKSRLRSAWWTGFLSFTAGVVLAAGPVRAYEVLTPPLGGANQVNSRRPQSHLVIKATTKEEAGQLRVARVQGGEGADSEETAARGQAVKAMGSWEKDGAVYVHYLLDLQKGANTYSISPGDKELAIRYQPLRTLLKTDPDDPKAYLFHRGAVVPAACGGCHTEQLPAGSGLDEARLNRNKDYSPVCYSCHRKLTSDNKWLHAPAATVACMTCHRRDGEGNKIATQVGRVDEACFSCHLNKRKWNDNAFVHGPAATGDCTVCHDPHGADYPYMLWADPKVDVCIACHTDKQDIRKSRRGYFPHGILEGNGCSACHSPHASDYQFQLAGTINEVCVSCHVSMKGIKEGHPVGRHPLSGVDDPRRKGRELSCASCHNPHGGEYKKLLIGNMLGGHVCSKCHN